MTCFGKMGTRKLAVDVSVWGGKAGMGVWGKQRKYKDETSGVPSQAHSSQLHGSRPGEKSF